MPNPHRISKKRAYEAPGAMFFRLSTGNCEQFLTQQNVLYVTRSDHNPIEPVEQYLLASAVVELGGARAGTVIGSRPARVPWSTLKLYRSSITYSKFFS